MVRKSSRVISIIAILQSGRPYNARQLTEECGVTRRTVFRDLIALQDAAVNPIYAAQPQTYSLPARQVPAGQLTPGEVAVCAELQKPSAGLVGIGALVALRDFIQRTDRVRDVARRRVIHRETVPNSDKLFSIFEPHT